MPSLRAVRVSEPGSAATSIPSDAPPPADTLEAQGAGHVGREPDRDVVLPRRGSAECSRMAKPNRGPKRSAGEGRGFGRSRNRRDRAGGRLATSLTQGSLPTRRWTKMKKAQEPW